MNLCGTRTPSLPYLSMEVMVFWRGGVNWPQNKQTAKAESLSKSVDFIHEVLDEVASGVNLTEAEVKERILRKEEQMNRTT
ncbi:hypothetical protein TNCV_690361 [Trichonephila clavipes]|nr:hypothetical protein TNCV_690361 [Trichonephila clavipes]